MLLFPTKQQAAAIRLFAFNLLCPAPSYFLPIRIILIFLSDPELFFFLYWTPDN